MRRNVCEGGISVAEAASMHPSIRSMAVSQGQSAQQYGKSALTNTNTLSDRDEQILAFERQWWKYAGAKEDAIRELFALSATHYYQILNALIDTDEALAYDPMLVKRLRRLRTTRQRARTARRLSY